MHKGSNYFSDSSSLHPRWERMAHQRLLALVPDAALEPDLRAEVADGVVFTRAGTLSAFLEALPKAEWTAAMVSLASELVSPAMVERIARAPGCGALLLTTPNPSLEMALLAQRVGALAVLPEPVTARELRQRLEPLRHEGPEIPLPDSHEEVEATEGPPRLIGQSREMAAIFETIAMVAGSDATVLLTGESGTGKEVVAQVLHDASAREAGPFVPVNCAAIPEQLLETELFGHEEGAFTGATGARKGRFERANGGTLFLDEIGDMSLVLQAKLLRALESRHIEPLGGIGARPIDVRVVAATNQDLQVAMTEGSFREDLYFRLAVVEIYLPPLRDRPEDIPPLALHFAATQARSHRRAVSGITEAAMQRLTSYAWPGNVRELRNVLDRAVLLAVGPLLRSGHLRLDQASPRISPRPKLAAHAGYPPTFSLEQVEADHIDRVVEAHEGHLARAAEILGIHRNTLSRKLRQRETHGPPGGAPS